MTKRIQTYRDLLDEKERLQALLAVQKETLRQDLREIKEELTPLRSAVAFAGKLITKDRTNTILNAGADTLINLVIKKVLLARAGWFTKFVVPLFVKNYSSHFISEKKDAIVKKLFSWIGKKNANGREKTPHDHH